MLDEDVEIVTVLVGENVEQTNIDAIAAYLEETDEDIELEIHQGGQPVYPFLFSVE